MRFASPKRMRGSRTWVAVTTCNRNRADLHSNAACQDYLQLASVGRQFCGKQSVPKSKGVNEAAAATTHDVVCPSQPCQNEQLQARTTTSRPRPTGPDPQLMALSELGPRSRAASVISTRSQSGRIPAFRAHSNTPEVHPTAQPYAFLGTDLSGSYRSQPIQRPSSSTGTRPRTRSQLGNEFSHVTGRSRTLSEHAQRPRRSSSNRGNVAGEISHRPPNPSKDERLGYFVFEEGFRYEDGYTTYRKLPDSKIFGDSSHYGETPVRIVGNGKYQFFKSSTSFVLNTLVSRASPLLECARTGYPKTKSSTMAQTLPGSRSILLRQEHQNPTKFALQMVWPYVLR